MSHDLDESAKKKLAKLLSNSPRLDMEKTAVLRELVDQMTAAISRIDIPEVWEQDQLASTYWILFMSGVDQEDEGLLARELLFWSAVFTKHSARAACIQSSDRRLFKYCTTYFRVKRWPTLVFSDRPDMIPFLSIDGELLAYLSKQRGSIRRLLTELHALAESGTSVEEIAQMIATEQFWKRLQLVYSEAKSLISFSIKAGSVEISKK